MRPATRKLLAAVLCLGLAFAACDRTPAGAPGPGGEKALRVAVIPKGTTHEFWKSIHAGAARAARELGVQIYWKGPEDYASYVATDNYKGGVLAARRLGELLGGKGRIFLIRYQEGSASTTQREAGFRDTVAKEFPGLTLLVQDQYAGATTETAYQLAENLLGRFPDVEGVFTPNESSTFGMLRALQESGLAGRVPFVGFDSSPKLIQGLRDGHLRGLVLQNPVQMGYLGVKTVVARLRGETVAKVIDTGVVLATSDNMDSPDIRALLSPDLSAIDDR
ncbi:MAG: substrate-binding domain-containing protein [Acidobacteria bacterium]|nr:substrate-binding domain-containing protein [Acidobacteriota bacterium]